MRNHSVISHTSRPLPYSGHPRDLRSKTRQLPLSGCPAPLPISGTRPPPRLKSTAFLFTASLFFLDPDLHPHVTHPSPSVRVSPATFPAPAHALIFSPNLAWGRFPIHARHSDPPDYRKSHPDVEHRGPLASSWCRSIVSPLLPMLLGFPIRLHTFSVKHTQE